MVITGISKISIRGPSPRRSAMIEIEKTFLVKQIPANLKKYKFSKIKQGYISDLPHPLRIRQNGDKFELTKKFMIGNDIKVQEEVNLPITSEEFNKFWPLTISSIEKTRYYISILNNLTAELDIFEGKMSGYQVVEVEFKSEQDMNNFVPPDWFGPDISLEDIASSRKLSTMTINDVKTRLISLLHPIL